MTTRSSFTKEQWDLVARAPVLAGSAVSVLDFGVVSVIKESTAIVRAVQAAARATKSDLVQAVAEGLDEPAGPPVEASRADKGAVVEELLGQVRLAVQHVEAAAEPAEAAEYKKLILDVASAAAGASGSGFLGMGEKVSAEERAYLERLRGVIEA